MSLEDFGAGLRAKREEQGLSLTEVSEQTRIHVRHLRAIESGEIASLPGHVYARAFVKHYARILSLDPVETVNEFDTVVARIDEVAGGRSHRARRKRRGRRRQARGAWQGIGVVVILVVIGIWIARILK